MRVDEPVRVSSTRSTVGLSGPCTPPGRGLGARSWARRRDEIVEDVAPRLALGWRRASAIAASRCVPDDRARAPPSRSSVARRSSCDARPSPPPTGASSRAAGTASRRARSPRDSRLRSARPCPPRRASTRPSRTWSSTPRRAPARSSTGVVVRELVVLLDRPARSPRAPPRGRGGRCAGSCRRGSGIAPLNRSSFASASSRIEIRKLARRSRRSRARGSSVGERARRPSSAG